MAKDLEDDRGKLTSEERVSNVIINRNGQEELSTDFVRQEYENEEDNTEHTITRAQHLEGSDGTLISATQLGQPESRGGVALQRCDGCVGEAKTLVNWLLHRNHPQITFAPAKNMRRCVTCRRALCEKHYMLSRDNQVRCQHCNQHFKIRQYFLAVVRWIFLRRIDHE